MISILFLQIFTLFRGLIVCKVVAVSKKLEMAVEVSAALILRGMSLRHRLETNRNDSFLSFDILLELLVFVVSFPLLLSFDIHRMPHGKFASTKTERS